MNSNKYDILFYLAGALALLVISLAQNVSAMDAETTEKLRLRAVNALKYSLPVDGHSSSIAVTSGGASEGAYIGATSGISSLGCTPNASDAVRGLTVGCTFYDFQRNGSMNRMIATSEPTHVLNFTWMHQTNNSATLGRNVRYEGHDPAFGFLLDGAGGVDIGGSIIPPDRSGYTSIDSRGSSGLAVNAHHWDPSFGAGGTFNIWVFYNQTPGLADFTGLILDTSNLCGVAGCATPPIWPRVAYTNDGAGTEITHILSHGRLHFFVDDPEDVAFYQRKVGSGNSGSWTTPIVVGRGGYHFSAAITASRKAGSQKVVIAGAFGRGDGTELGGFGLHGNGAISGDSDNDLFYMESTDAGANWGPLTNLTMRPDSLAGGFAPGAKLTVLYDQSDNFHIVWQTMVWNGYEGPFTGAGQLRHYDPLSDKIRIVHDFNWQQTMCNGGLFNLNATNPQLSECDGKLYVTFEQFNDIPNGIVDDCSERALDSPEGAANGDIYVTVSDNDGQNWDVKRNLTSTYTPDCDTLTGGAKSDCDSDVWHSATRYGIDIDVNFDDFDNIADLSGNIGGYVGPNYIFVQYINDADPGGAINAEGTWTNNSVNVFRYGCVEKISNAVLISSLQAGQTVADPAFTLPGTDSTLNWTLTNIGNLPANYSISITNMIPTNNVTLAGGALAGVISEGDLNTENFTVTLNAGLETVVQNAHAEIVLTGDFVGSPMFFAIDYTIGDITQRKIDTLANSLVFSNTGGVGLQNNSGDDGLTMDFQNAPGSAECDSTGNADNYLFDGSPIISYNGGQVVTSMYSANIVDSFQFRPLTDPSSDEVSNPDWFIGNSGQFTTQDSTLCFTVDYFSPKTTIFDNPNWKLVFGRARYYNTTTSPIDSVFCAYGWDWDVPSDSGKRNTTSIDPTNILISIRGGEWGQDTGNAACLPNDERWAATIYVPPFINNLPQYADDGSGAMSSGFQSMYTRNNAEFVSSDWDHAKLDTALHTMSGFSKFSSPSPDSQEVDLHLVLNGGAYRIDPDDTLSLWFIMVTGIGDQASFDSCVALATNLGPPVTPSWNLGCCHTAGDFNSDGVVNIADVTACIARIFLGGPAPACIDEADANGDNLVNIADCVYLISRIFSGGPAPVCGTTGN